MNITLNLIIIILNLILWILFYVNYKKHFSTDKILGEIQEEVEKLLLDMNTATDRDISLVEDRIQILKNYLSKADEKIEILKKEKIAEQIIQTKKIEQAKILLIKPEEQIEPMKPLKKQVLDLYKQGLSSDVIAEKLKVSQTEVQMIVDMFA